MNLLEAMQQNNYDEYNMNPQSNSSSSNGSWWKNILGKAVSTGLDVYVKKKMNDYGYTGQSTYSGGSQSAPVYDPNTPTITSRQTGLDPIIIPIPGGNSFSLNQNMIMMFLAAVAVLFFIRRK